MTRKRTAAITVAFVLALALASPRLEAMPADGQPQLAGTLPDVEQAIFRAVKRVSWVIWIAADTNGHLTIASLGFTYPSAPPDVTRLINARAWRLAQLAFTAVSTLDEVHLSGVQQGDVELELGHPTVTFSAAISRTELLAVPETIPGSEAVTGLPRVWYASGSASARVGAPESQGAGSQEPAQPDPQPPVQLSPNGGRSSRVQGRRPAVSPVPIVFRGDPARREVAITFDDGPFPIYTTLLLDTLDHLGLKGTFFVVGEQVQRYPYFARAIVNAGHEVGNHTFHHLRLSQLSERQIEEEITRAQEVIAEVTGQRPRYFRPPGGKYAIPVIRTATALGLTTVFWTANSGDYTQPGTAVLEAKILGRVNSGGILLLHQGVGETIRILPQTTEVLRHRGLILTTVSGLLAP